MSKLAIVLDTSIFVNPDGRLFFGDTIEGALNNFLDKLKKKDGASCFMPPSVYEELMKFIKNAPSTEKTILIKRKPPSSYQTSVPSLFLYEFIDEMRLRMNKGLRIGEKYTRRAAKIDLLSEKKKEDELIRRLREEYRVALREGIIDSKEDFDLLLLAKELNAQLATQDFGLTTWAHKLGITCITAQELKEIIS